MKKKAILWFYKGITIEEDNDILDVFDSQDYEIHIFNDVNENNLLFDNIFYIINILFNNNLDDYEIYIASNVKEFILIEYILYKQWINGFLYLNNNGQHINTNKFYSSILDETINKTNGKNFYVIKNEEGLFEGYSVLKDPYEFNDSDNNFENEIYYINGENHIFSFKTNIETNIIKIDNSDIDKCNKYVFHYNIDYVDDIINKIKYYSSISTKEFANNFGHIQQLWEEIYEVLNIKNLFELNLAKFKLEKSLYDFNENDRFIILLCSALINIYHESKYIDFFVETLVNSKTLSKENKFFCYYQLKRYNFLNKNEDNKIYKYLKILYDNIYDDYLAHRALERVQKNQRDDQFIYVFTSQFLSEHHSPTKVALDICYNLIKHFNKKVILINTKECLTLEGMIPMFNITRGNVVEQFSSINSINWKDTIIPFYQPYVNMPDDQEIDIILNSIQKNKPYLIINIGQSIVGDIASNIIPAVTVPLGMYEYSRSNFYAVNNEHDKELYTKLYDFKEENMITSKLAFELKNQVEKFNKKQLNIPNNRFILTVVGNRLNFELDDDFLRVLDICCNELNAFVVFISNYEFNNEQKKQYEYLFRNFKNMGFQKDLLAIMEHVDLFINPRRKGGGTSAIYALYKGKPVITLNYGDVAKNVGDEFCCETYSEMYNLIKKYYLDKDFYMNQSKIAKEKALQLTNTKVFIKNILDFFE
ncbi:hypothetical protein E8P77_01155 [Soehngenia saccharolytica]|nr:hypothetical protein E8P77_01155 [Soehngenia saccharolytica]